MGKDPKNRRQNRGIILKRQSKFCCLIFESEADTRTFPCSSGLGTHDAFQPGLYALFMFSSHLL